MDSEQPLHILDACCVINLLASGEAEAILSGLPFPIAVADLVAEHEVLHIRPPLGADNPETEPEEVAVTLEPLVQAGIVQVACAESSGELATFVELALSLDDGEALSAALAIHRGAVLVTDDRKALRVTAALAPELPLRRTSYLIRSWYEAAAPEPARLRQALVNIRDRGSFMPPRDDPERAWWEGWLEG